MDKIQDFLKELRSRFSSPFFSSFILAWLIINWRIPVAMLFYKSTDFSKTEHDGYIGLIEQTVTFWSGIIAPVIVATVYTLISPLLRNGIRALYAYIDSKGSEWSLAAAKEGKISVDKYMQLRNSYKKREDALIKLYDEESNLLKANNELHEKVDDYRTKFTNMSAHFEELRSFSDVRTYNGHWLLTYLDYTGEQRTDTVIFNSGDIQKTDRGGRQIFKILRIGYTADSRELTLTMEDRLQVTPQIFYAVLYSPTSERFVYINREMGQKIERMERVVGAPKK